MRGGKRLLILLLGLVPALLPQDQMKSTVFGTFHDIPSLGGGCKTCHLAHQRTTKGEVLLWARNFTTNTTFGIYTSPTMDNIPIEVGGNYSESNLPTGAKIYTVLCLSCHDGLTTPSVISPTSPRAIANPETSDGLRNDHPVNMTYIPEGGLEPASTVEASPLKLFAEGQNKTVQCASCHDPHNNQLGYYLRVANVAAKSGLCTTCHL
jgi:predicted CXXCH cytochrome family protein